ncbi:hypothetical protein LINGRAHAP2_LOCUS36054 [Linum grandiflorum]
MDELVSDEKPSQVQGVQPGQVLRFSKPQRLREARGREHPDRPF